MEFKKASIGKKKSQLRFTRHMSFTVSVEDYDFIKELSESADVSKCDFLRTLVINYKKSIESELRKDNQQELSFN